MQTFHNEVFLLLRGAETLANLLPELYPPSIKSYIHPIDRLRKIYFLQAINYGYEPR
jgi:hypothetical protein